MSIDGLLKEISSQQKEILQAVQARTTSTNEQPKRWQEPFESEPVNQALTDDGSGSRSALQNIGISMPPIPAPSFPNVHSSYGTSNFSAVGGDHSTVDSSTHISNTNSGNTSTTITKNSNNDTSIRVLGSYRISVWVSCRLH